MTTCPCGRSPDPGVRPGGGCYCTEANNSEPRPRTRGERHAYAVGAGQALIDAEKLGLTAAHKLWKPIFESTIEEMGNE